MQKTSSTRSWMVMSNSNDIVNDEDENEVMFRPARLSFHGNMPMDPFAEEEKDSNKNHNRHHQKQQQQQQQQSHSTITANNNNNNNNENGEIIKKKFEYGALSPGQIVRIRIGDPSRGRKAWKKRRRSGSPILIPCSIVDIDLYRMIQWNLMYLLYESAEKINGRLLGGSMMMNEEENTGGLCISLKKINTVYKRIFGGNLSVHAKTLGYETVNDLISTMFHPETTNKDTYGIKVISTNPEKEENDPEQYLVTPLSFRQARMAARSAARAQFLSSSSSTTQDVVYESNHDNNNNDDDTTSIHRMMHTGHVKLPPQSSSTSSSSSSPPPIELLSVAIRISQQKDSERFFQEGDECNAFVYSYDSDGDAGSPLLILSMDPPPRPLLFVSPSSSSSSSSVNPKKQKQQYNANSNNKNNNNDASLNLLDLQIGYGPICSKIVRISPQSGAIFVDCSVIRERGKARGGGMESILGMLRFDDLILPSFKDNSSDGDGDEKKKDDDEVMLSVKDEVDSNNNDDDDDEMTIENLFEFSQEDNDNDDKNNNDDTTTTQLSNIIIQQQQTQEQRKHFIQQIQKHLSINDEINVYIKSIFRQSGRFMVTCHDPSSSLSSSSSSSSSFGNKPRDIKKERIANKRMLKLAQRSLNNNNNNKQQQQNDGIQRLNDLVGIECEGIVKAESKTGNWYYVQPIISSSSSSSSAIKNDEKNRNKKNDDNNKLLPVGVAKLENNNENDDDTMMEDLNSSSSSSIHPGDRVLVRLQGIDKTRGQLAMTLLRKTTINDLHP